MMTEIFVRGPIACSIYAHSEAFTKYKGNLFTIAS